MQESGGLFSFPGLFDFFGKNPDDGDDTDMAGGGGSQNCVMAEEPVEAQNMAEPKERKMENKAFAYNGRYSSGCIYLADACSKKS